VKVAVNDRKGLKLGRRVDVEIGEAAPEEKR
jgi:hypothetical protein